MRNCFVILLFFLFLLGPKSVIPSTINDIVRVNQPLSEGVFLIATHDLGGSYFSNAVILLAKYSHKGALGVVINRPSGISLSEALPDFKGLKKDFENLFIGGPVARFSPFTLIRTDKEIKNIHHIFDNTFYSTDIKSIAGFILNKNSKDRMRVYAGHAGWFPGQLETEVARGSWTVIRADQYTVFDKEPGTIWEDLMKRDAPLFIKESDNEISPIQLSKSLF